MAPAAVRHEHWAPGLLVVDGDPATRQLLRDFFASAGFESEEADDLQTALGRVAGARPAAVVLHDGIADAQGIEILETLRTHHPDLPVIFIANSGGADARAAAARCAATAYLGKPFRMADLLATVVRAVHFPGLPPRARHRAGRRGFRADRLSAAERLESAELARERTA